MADYYQVLGIASDANEAEIRAAYRKKAKLFHPDVNKSPDAHSKFVMVTAAYETLINYNKRENYNLRSKSSSSRFQSYNEWMQAQRAKAEFEARMRYYEFLSNREKFRDSRFYWLAVWITHLARIVCYVFGTGVIGVCMYLIYDYHFMLLFFLLPFICAGVYFIIWTGDWFKETRRYF
jgi:hypothetical protein